LLRKDQWLHLTGRVNASPSENNHRLKAPIGFKRQPPRCLNDCRAFKQQKRIYKLRLNTSSIIFVTPYCQQQIPIEQSDPDHAFGSTVPSDDKANQMPPVGAEETPLCGRHLIQVSVALGAETMDAPDPGMFKPHEQMMLELDLGRRARALRARSDRTAPTLWGRREGEKLGPSPLPSSATGKQETRAAMRFSISERPHPGARTRYRRSRPLAGSAPGDRSRPGSLRERRVAIAFPRLAGAGTF